VQRFRWSNPLARWGPPLLASAGVLALGAPSFALGDDSGESDDGAAAPPVVLTTNEPTVEYAPGQLLVGLEEDASKAEIKQAVKEAGATVEDSIDPIDAKVLEVPKREMDEAIESLESSSAVEYVEREVLLEATDTVPDDGLWKGQWGPRRVAAQKAWDTTKGSAGVTIAVLDTGVDYSHPDLQAMFVPGYDFVNRDDSARDDHGHGTAAAGVIAARTDNGKGQAGICWRCRVMPVKVLGANGQGTTSDIAAGILWAVAHEADVISLSLGGAGSTQTLANAVEAASSEGIPVIAAAGNAGSTTPFYPAAYPDALSVAGTTSSDKLYEWSNRGSWVEVAAPGCNTSPVKGGGYANFCGTSSATPIVAGIAGLVLSLAPELPKEKFEHALKSTAVRMSSGVRYGRVDALKTLAALGLIRPENTRRPSIRGVASSGRTLEADKGGWRGAPTRFTYSWQRCNQAGTRCSNIKGATSRTYRVGSADAGSKLRVVVRAANRMGATSASSPTTKVVTRAAKSAGAAAQSGLGGRGAAVGAAGTPSSPGSETGGPSPPSSSSSPLDAVSEQLDSTISEATETAGDIADDPPAP
jgi:subtilisin family serine protease